MQRLLTAVVFTLLAMRAAGAAEFVGGLECPTETREIAGTICHDGDLARLNADLREAYRGALPAIPEHDRDMVRQAQQEWLDALKTCLNFNKDEESECLNGKMKDQIALLTGAPLSGPLRGFSLKPFEQKLDDRTVLRGLYLRLDNPTQAGEIEYNRIVDALIAGASNGKKTVGEPPTSDEQWVFAGLKLTYASPRLISLKLESGYGCGGCGDEAWRDENFNIDMATGKLIEIGEIFPVAAIAQMAIQCGYQIVREKLDRRGLSAESQLDDLDWIATGVADVITAQRNWAIGDTEVEISFPVNTVGSYEEMYYECHLPTVEVRSLAREGGPLR